MISMCWFCAAAGADAKTTEATITAATPAETRNELIIGPPIEMVLDATEYSKSIDQRIKGYDNERQGERKPRWRRLILHRQARR